MPANTPLFGFPYPLGTDRVMDGDNAIGALALQVEAQLSGAAGTTPGAPWRSQAGAIYVAGSLAAGAVGSATFTFAVGRFSVIPVVIASVATASGYCAVSTSGATAASVLLRVVNPHTVASGTVYGWVWAVQMNQTSGSGFRDIELEPPTGDPYLATCHTEGCDNAGHAIPITWDVPEVAPVVGCGVCGQPITDVVGA